MRCEPGDLAIVVCSSEVGCPPEIGKIIKIDKLSWIYKDCWVPDPPILDPKDGYQVHVPDEHLRPIRDPGDDAVDETLLRLPSPRQEVTA